MATGLIDRYSNTITWNCLDECVEDFPDTKILLVGVTPTAEIKLYDLGCAADTWQNPGVYDNDRLVGTHWLANEMQQELFPDDENLYHPQQWVEDCRGMCTSGAPVIVVAIDAQGGFHLLCADCALEVQEKPDHKQNQGLVLYGTHILTDELVREIYPEDFDDEE